MLPSIGSLFPTDNILAQKFIIKKTINFYSCVRKIRTPEPQNNIKLSTGVLKTRIIMESLWKMTKIGYNYLGLRIYYN